MYKFAYLHLADNLLAGWGISVLFKLTSSNADFCTTEIISWIDTI